MKRALGRSRRELLLTCALGLLWCGLLCAPTALAQSSNTRVSGTVRDANEGVVGGATLTLTDAATGRTITSTSDAEGFFTFTDLRAGAYSFTAEAPGFKRTEVSNVVVNVDQQATVNVTLEVGGVGETVTVASADAQALVNTENAQLSTTVLDRQIQDLPLNGRNPLQLASLQAGVNSGTGSTRTATVNGMRGTFTNLTWDGININDNYIRTNSFFGVAAPSVVSVSEFTLTTQNASASDGLGVVQLKLVTPRGSKDFRGSVYEYHRNDVFDANDFFNNASGVAKPKLIQNQFGASLGGPLLLPRFGEGGPRSYGRDKLFFFGYYEGTITRTDTTTLRTVLTDPARAGNFTYRRSDNGQLQTVNLLQLTGRTADPTTRGLIAQTPLPNAAGAGDGRNTSGFRFNSPSGFDIHLWGFRVDYDLSDRHRFEAVYSRFTYDLPNDAPNAIDSPFPGLPGVGQSSVRPRGSFAWSWTPTASLNNELRGGFNYYDVNFVSGVTFDRNVQLTLPLVTNPVQNTLPQGRDVKVNELLDNANWVRGRHLLKFGGNFRLVDLYPFNDGGVLANYTLGFGTNNANPLGASNAAQFPGGITAADFNTATGLLALLTGSVTSVTQLFNATDRTSGFVPGAGVRQHIRNWNLGGYAEDTWRLRPNLTVNAGVRYEFISVPEETSGLLLFPVGGSAALRDPRAVLDFTGADTGRKPFGNDLNNFAPNVSFAWDPWGEGRSAVRGGYRISYVIDNNVTTLINAAVGNDGLTQTVTVNGLPGTVSGGGLAPVVTPQFRVPRTIADNIAINPGAALFAFDTNFRTPYVQQWNVGVEREVLRDLVFEARYVGNRGTKLTRAIDLNQVRIFDNGFYEDFLRAQRNLAANGNPAVGEPLQILPRLGLGGFLTDGSVRNMIRTGQVGDLAAFYYTNRSFFLDGAFGGDPSLTPAFFARTNPNAFVVDYIGNGSYSTYHGLQTEVRRRPSRGLYFQANYTFSKGFSDYEGGQTNFSPLIDLGSGGVVEKRRVNDDVTHVFKANGVYELPFGSNRRFFNRGGAFGKLLGGWSLNGILQWQSGAPVSLLSRRGTVNRSSGSRSNVNTVNTNLTVGQLQSRTGLFYDPQTGLPLLFDPEVVRAVRANPDNNPFFTNPGAGRLGQLQLTPVSGPGFFNLDLSLIKRTAVTERADLEFRVEAFNVLNHTNFGINQNQVINSSNFGALTSTLNPRVIQFAAKFNF